MTDSQTQQTRVGHCLSDTTETYIGRSEQLDTIKTAAIRERGWLGNPFVLSDQATESHRAADHITIVDTRSESLDRFRELFETRLNHDDEFRTAVASLAGEDLGGWCHSLADGDPACHGDIIAEWADRLAAAP